MEVNRENLIKTLNLVRPAVAAQAYIAALTHFQFDGVSVCAYNDISAISVRSDVELELCLPAEMLIKLLSSLSSETVLITVDDETVLMSAGRSKLKLPSLPISDFPFNAPDGKALGTFQMTADLLKGLEKCLVGVGQDPTHPAQMGVTLQEPDVGGGAQMFTTDNFTISWYDSETDVSLPGGVPVIMPTFFCQQLVVLSKAFPSEPITIDLYKGALLAKIGEQALLFTRLLVDLEPMDFQRIIRRYLEGENLNDLLFDIPDSFDPAFDRALLILSSEMDKATKVSLKDGRLKLYSSSSGHGESNDVLSMKAPDADPFHVDPGLVSRASKICRKIGFLPKVMVMADGRFTHLIAHCSA